MLLYNTFWSSEGLTSLSIAFCCSPSRLRFFLKKARRDVDRANFTKSSTFLGVHLILKYTKNLKNTYKREKLKQIQFTNVYNICTYIYINNIDYCLCYQPFKEKKV